MVGDEAKIPELLAEANRQLLYAASKNPASIEPALLDLPGVDGPRLVFVNGRYRADLSRLAGIDRLRTRLGIELRNPTGDITVASNWNLGAAELDANGNLVRFLYRHGNDAPVLTLRAAGNLNINASLTDGFVQLSNPLGLQAPRARSFEQVQALFEVLGRAYPALADGIEAPVVFTSDGSATQEAQIAQYYGLYEQYLNYLLYGRLPVGSLDARPITDRAPLTRIETLGVAQLGLGAPVAPVNAQGYANYLVEYDAYLARIEGSAFDRRVALPSAPTAALAALFTGAALAGQTGVDNSASPTASTANPLPLAAASLAGGASSSYRLIAGADFESADVLGVQQPGTVGNITLSGSGSYTDPVTAATILQPTLVRTGTGSIDLAAAGNFVLADALAPGVVYTAGAPRAGTVADSGSSILQPALYSGNAGEPLAPTVAGQSVVSGFVQPEAAGDLRLSVGGDIVGQQSAYANGSTAGQYWWSWLDTGNDVRFALDNAHNGANGLVAGGRWTVPAKVMERPVIDQSWDYALTMQFKNIEDHDAYQVDADHNVFIGTFKDWWAQVQVKDLA